MAVGHLAVEAGDHGPCALDQGFQGGVAGLLVNGAVEIEADPVGGVNELIAQICRHQLGGEVFAPAGQLVLGDLLGIDAVFQHGKFRFQIDLQAQLIPDAGVAGNDHVVNLGAVHTVLGVGMAQVQKVRNFVVLGKTLACGGDHHHLPVRVRLNDIANLAVLPGICHGTAAKFDYFHVLVLSLL